MQTTLAIITGPDAGREFVLQKEFTRIGSAAHCEVQLTDFDVEAHAVTIARQGNDCTLFNRGSQTLEVGQQFVAPGETMRWNQDVPLKLSLETSIIYQMMQKRAPASPSPAALPPETVEAYDPHAGEAASAQRESSWSDLAEPESETSSDGLKSLVQLGVTIGCLAGCAILLVAGGEKKTSPVAGPTLAELLADEQKLPDDDSARDREAVVDRLRQAYKLRRVEDKEAAKRLYDQVLAIASRHVPREDWRVAAATTADATVSSAVGSAGPPPEPRQAVAMVASEAGATKWFLDVYRYIARVRSSASGKP